MDSQSFFKRQRAVLLSQQDQSDAKIGLNCIIVDINPYSRREHPQHPDRWRVRIFLPATQAYREVRAGDLLGLHERDESPLPIPPNE